MKRIVSFLIALSLVIPVTTKIVKAEDKPVVITVDAGHGGKDSGATYTHDGKKVYEKTLNLKIAKAIRDELETYDNVVVYMTRTGDTYPTLSERVELAVSKKSDLLFSAHINASVDHKSTGMYALVSRGLYRPKLAEVTKAIGKNCLTYLHNVTGMTDRGYLLRTLSDTYYPGKIKADYYYIIRQGVIDNIPSMIMEHGFIDNAADYSKLNSDAELKTIGQVDATAIAEYFNLSKKSEVAYNEAAEALEEAQSPYDDAKAAYEQALADKQELTDEIDNLDSGIAEAQEQVTKDQQAIEETQATINSLNEQLEALSEDEDDEAIQADLDTAQQELEALKAKLAEDENALTTAQDNYETSKQELEARLAELETTISELYAVYQAAKNDYQAALNTYNKALKAYEADLASISSFKAIKLSKPSVTVKNTSDGINLSWKKVPYAAGYKVYRASSKSGTYSKIKTLSASKLSYTDTSVTNGKAAYYKVYAYLDDQSVASSVKTMVYLTSPSITYCKNVKKKSIKVKWTKNDKATGYVVRYVKGSTTKTVTVKGAATLSKTIKSLTKKKTYKVSVRAYKTLSDTKYYSPYSSAQSVKIKK
ncbi:MAG: N-acetylmuramoyl-L-alanine amidase [Erysipelotrichaceae bacterium]|nr:N-acetylmuramoyl-L-alanine amidase [Erysipelotrichaceae bacterium]